MTRPWEYKVQPIEIGGHDAGIGELTRLGNEGWELVQVIGEPTEGRGVPCIFKRPRPTEPQDVND
jgi:hypothetical protein